MLLKIKYIVKWWKKKWYLIHTHAFKQLKTHHPPLLLQEYEALTKKTDCNPDVWVNLACTYFFLGMYTQAEQAALKGEMYVSHGKNYLLTWTLKSVFQRKYLVLFFRGIKDTFELCFLLLFFSIQHESFNAVCSLKIAWAGGAAGTERSIWKVSSLINF